MSERAELIGGSYASHYAATGECLDSWHSRKDSVLYICNTCGRDRSGTLRRAHPQPKGGMQGLKEQGRDRGSEVG